MNKILLGTLLCSVTIFASIDTKQCVGCYGINFAKKALGKSKIVAKMQRTDVIKALTGYKNNTYGGSMKAIMQGQNGLRRATIY